MTTSPSLPRWSKNTLNPGLPIYVEYSNEVWNSQFTQYTYNLDQAVAEVQSDPTSNLDYDGLPVTSANYKTFAQRLYARRRCRSATSLPAFGPAPAWPADQLDGAHGAGRPGRQPGCAEH